MVGVLTGQFVSGVSAVIDVRPRAVGSEHFVTTDFNPLRQRKKQNPWFVSARTNKKRQLKEK
jgi:hypothetical protein